MNLSSKNLFARYYNWIYGELPNDLCSFFWGTLFAIVLSPLLVLGRLWGPNSLGKLFGVGLVHYMMYGIFLCCGVSPYGEFFMGIEDVELFSQVFDLNPSNVEIFIYMPLLGLGFLCAAILLAGAIVGAVYGVYKLFSVTGSTFSESVSGTTVIQNTKDFVGAIRGKYCTKINWK